MAVYDSLCLMRRGSGVVRKFRDFGLLWSWGSCPTKSTISIPTTYLGSSRPWRNVLSGMTMMKQTLGPRVHILFNIITDIEVPIFYLHVSKKSAGDILNLVGSHHRLSCQGKLYRRCYMI